MTLGTAQTSTMSTTWSVGSFVMWAVCQFIGKKFLPMIWAVCDSWYGPDLNHEHDLVSRIIRRELFEGAARKDNTPGGFCLRQKHQLIQPALRRTMPFAHQGICHLRREA